MVILPHLFVVMPVMVHVPAQRQRGDAQLLQQAVALADAEQKVAVLVQPAHGFVSLTLWAVTFSTFVATALS